MKIYVISRKGKLLETIKRKGFIGQDRRGFPERQVRYKGKKYPVYDLSGTAIGGFGIYPYGKYGKIGRRWIWDIEKDTIIWE